MDFLDLDINLTREDRMLKENANELIFYLRKILAEDFIILF